MSESKCPNCGGELHAVTRPSDSCLSPDQFDAVRAGDFYCMKCPSNDRGNTGYRYFWERELMDAKDAEIAALTEKLRIVEAERDEMKRKYETQCAGSMSAHERRIHLEADLSALRAELQRKDAALREVLVGDSNISAWGRRIIDAALENLENTDGK